MKRSLIAMLIIALFALWALPGFTQTLEYAFSATQGTYTPISGGLLLGTETSDDQRFLDPAAPVGATTTTGPGLDIGFSFTFNGAAFDRLAINNNGWISLGQSALTPSVNNSSTSGYTPIQSVVAITPEVLYNRIAGLARDLQAQVGATLRLETIGTAPNRICVVQWANYKKYGTTGTGDSFNFQIQLHETSNNVKIVYGQMVSNATVGNMQVGLRGPLATDFNSRQGTGSWTETTAASLNTQYVVLNDVNFPANGLTFNFNYPIANQAPNPANLVSPANAAILVSPSATLNWVSGGNLPTGYRFSFGTNNPPTNVVNNLDLAALTSYDPNPDLALNTTYYWQVIPYNSFGSAANCPVWSFTTHGDPTITTLPYSQNWDLVTAPDLPFDWTSIYQANVTTGYVKTDITSPHSAPNCIRMYNPTDINTIAMLIGPQLSTTIPANTIRIKFWGKGSAAYHVLVGVMTDPADPATFVSIEDVNTIANWNEYVVSLAGYTGAGRYIAFKHASTAAGQTIYLDGITFEVIAPNDLAAVSVLGNGTPSVNQTSNYTVNVYNWGTATQSAYSVKLMSGTTELASVAGPSIAAAATQSVVIPWTPTTAGPMALYGKVVLAGDANSANDESPVLNIAVQPAGATVVTVGEGNLQEGVPWEFYYKNSLHETLYYEAELGVMGNITAISFYNNFLTNLTDKPVKLWLGTTQLADLSAGWITPDQLTLVYDGTLNFPSGENTVVVPLQTPYLYTGGNLVLYANRPMDTAYFSSSDNFLAQTVGTNRARKVNSDSVVYDPAAPSAAGTLSGTFAKTSFTFVVTGMGSMSGTITSGGNPVAGATIQMVGANNYSQTSTATGTYNFPFLPIGNYTVTASKLGYENVSLPAIIVADQNTVLNFVLPASSTVNVTGFVVGSDAPTVGLAGATVHLDGPLDFDGTADATGHFTVTGVLSGNSYAYTIVKTGYSDLTGSITVGAGNYNMGTLIMNEVALPPVHIVATENDPHTQVTLTWRAPGSTGGGGVEDFEMSDGGWVPTSNWTNPLGDWQWANTYDVSNYVVGEYPTSEFPPLLAHSGTGLWGTILYGPYSMPGGFNYLTKTFNFSNINNPQMKFWSWNNSFGNFDYGQVAVNGTVVWGPAWDTNPIEWEEIVIDLAAYANMSEVTIQFQHYATTVVSYSGWYIDDVYVGAAQTMARNYPKSVVPEFMRGLSETDAAVVAENMNRNNPKQALRASTAFNNSRNSRALNGYKVWRLLQGNEANETTWTLLTAATLTDTTYTDTAWGTIPDGNYRWAVKGIYTNNMQGPVAFSNMLRILRNDLTATSLTGNTTPTAGTSTTYTVAIKNTGTLAKAAGTYTVKLLSGTTELASVSGPAIAPAEELNITLNWTPTTAGPLALIGKVVLPADTVPANDVSPVLSITVMPTGMVAITVGDGSQTEGKPLDFYYKNSLFECLYYPSEMGLFGTVTAISFYNTFITDLPNKPTKIWLGTTDLNDLSGGWILPPELTLVYDGNISYPAGENTVTIPLQTPFQYLSGNLVLYANRPWEEVSYNTNDNFLTQTIGSNRSRKLVSSTVTYDPAAPSAVGTLAGSFPKTTFHLTAGGPNPIFSLNPASKNWGTVLINSQQDQIFSIANAGDGTLSISNITITGSPMFSLQNLPTLPANMTFGQTTTFVARYMPTAVGNHTATITITDNMARSYTISVSSNKGSRLAHPVALSGTCIDTTLNTLPYAQAFDAVTIPDLPPDWSYIYQATVTTGYVKTVTTTPHSTPNCAAMYNPTDAATTAMLIAPPLGTTIPTNTTWVKFWGRSSGAGYPLSVGVMVNNTDPLTYTETEMISLTTTWTQYVVAFNGYTGAGKLITFKHGLGGTARTLYIDDVMIEVVPTNDLAALTISGNASPTVGTASEYNVVVKNWGTAAQPTYNVKLYNAAGTELATAPGLPCAPGATVNVPINWTPATAGSTVLYAKVVLTGDQNNLNDQTPNLTILVLPTGTWAITVGAGDQNARLPLDFYYKNSVYQGLYYPAEMGNFIGQINGIQLYNNFVTNLTAMPTKVWIGTTTETSLTAGWIAPANLSLVFDGTLDYPSGENLITIPFSTPYLYLNSENLVLMFNRPMDGGYYSSSDFFKCQTDAVNTTRSRRLNSDSVEYDVNALPTTGTVAAQFPKTTFLVIPGGVGHINGTVLGEGNQPLQGVAVQIPNSTYSATTNADGYYQIHNILPNTYSLSFSKYGYVSQTQTFTLEEDETEVINLTLVPMASVSLSGTILASDTAAGLGNVTIQFSGYQSYTATTLANGSFTIPAVYANQSYTYVASCPGYRNATGTVNVAAINHTIPAITLNEIAFAPYSVVAELNTAQTEAQLVWQAPNPQAVDVMESFEATTFPPTNWTQIINNTGVANDNGVLPTWCSFGTKDYYGFPAVPTNGNKQAGIGFVYSHQDEWLITHPFYCPPEAIFTFSTFVYRGSAQGDHYYVKISPDNGINWTVLWDATTLSGGYTTAPLLVTLNLAQYGGQQIKIAFHADDPATDDGLWYDWYIDNIKITNEVTSLSFNPEEMAVQSVSHTRSVQNTKTRGAGTERAAMATNATDSRALTGYKVWRLRAGQEANETLWNLLNTEATPTPAYNDAGWNSLSNGTYRWAVKAIYTNGVASIPVLSNPLTRNVSSGTISGVVRKPNNQPLAGATVAAGGNSTITNSSGLYSLSVPVGTYSVTCTATGYLANTIDNINVIANQSVTVNFIMIVSANEDEILPVTATTLNGNYPNPFNPETSISYAIKDAGSVSLEIYNLKGQRVRSLVHGTQTTGHYRIVFDGKDDHGQPLSSGVYLYRLTTGTYTSTRKMMLME